MVVKNGKNAAATTAGGEKDPTRWILRPHKSPSSQIECKVNQTTGKRRGGRWRAAEMAVKNGKNAAAGGQEDEDVFPSLHRYPTRWRLRTHKSPPSHPQEIGRAGRDGRLSYCHLFFDDITYYKLRSLMYSDSVNEYMVNKLLCQIFSSELGLKRICISQVILTILTQLELGEVQYLHLLPELNVTCSLNFHKSTGEVRFELKDPAYCYIIVNTPSAPCALTTHMTKWLSEIECCKVQKLDVMFNAAAFAVKRCERGDGCDDIQHMSCLQRRIQDYFNEADHSDLSTMMN